MYRALLVLAVAGCYHPSLPAGSPCISNDQCPAPLACNAGYCTSGDAGDIVRDAPPVDAAPDADLACSCQGETLACPSGNTTCSISCSTTGGPHCTALVPSNGVSTDLVSGTGTVTITGLTTLDTDTGQITGVLQRAAGQGLDAGIAYAQQTTQGKPIGVFAFHRLSVTAAGIVHFTGSRAAVILVGTDATVAGTIDLSGGCYGNEIQCPGPGGGSGALYTATAGGCGPGGAGTTDAATGADSGGGGGGAGSNGAIGGTETASGDLFKGGTAGQACLASDLEPLVGGSGGGGGGPGNGTATYGGGGGGALQLSALSSITISGVLDAGGAGGDTGPTDASNGGAPGGGGAGGAILLEAPQVTITAAGIVAANGGGGGGASDHLHAGTAGQNGQASAQPALGGIAGNNGTGSGGNGGAGSTAATKGGDATDVNSGAGGGGVGRIFVRSAGGPALAGTVSPSAGTALVRSQ
ncbi:MAG TPA: hypothetical protein VLX92_30595 [Kofleriaceae bacterium]|nr:hypothetical protein [Kofleriaceae bacterium]